MLITIFVLVITVILLLGIRIRRDRGLCNIPGPAPLPVIGNGLLFFGDTTHFLNQLGNLFQNYHKAVQIFLLHQRHVILWDAKLVQPLLSSVEYIHKADMYRYAKDWLGTGLLTSEGYKWKSHRKFLTPAFHFNILQSFLPIFIRNSNLLTDKLKSMADGRVIDVFPVIALAALDNVVETAMGVSIKAQTFSDSEYVRAVKDLSELLMTRILNPFMANDFIFALSPLSRQQKKLLKILHGFTRKVVKERRNELNDSGITIANYDFENGIKKKSAFLDLLLLSEIDGKKMDIEDVYEEVDTFMFEGHDTTTSAISFLLYALSKNQEVQEKVFEEQKVIFDDDLGKEPTASDLQQMKYLDLVIKESLRLYPAVPFIARDLKKDVEIEGCRIPKDTTVIFDIFWMQRNPDYFEKPLEFIPERFESGQKQNHLYSWIPFSAGPRNCIGQKFAIMTMKVTISSIVKLFTIKPSGVEPILGSEIVLKSQNGVQVKFTPRNL